ncbi:MAG: hypothetical protein IPJ04_17170 [Candidatus Eisenbacteria bacterium]|nr:hypothetical protein [Candidatus Eisenbacteria bacterium]
MVSLDTTGVALEGVLDVSLLTQRLHGTVYLALARYDSASGGALLAQVPAGDADGNVDGGEYAEWLGTTGVNPPALPPADGFAMALASESPSHAGTTVRLTLPHAARVDVRLLDVAGREVASIAHEVFKAGTHTVAWRPAPGRAPAPGVYFVEARSEGRTRTARLVLVR